MGGDYLAMSGRTRPGAVTTPVTTLNYSAHVLSVPERSMTEHTVLLDFDSADWTYKKLP